MTFGRVSTGDQGGKMCAYVGEGEFTADPLNTFGSRAVVKVRDLPRLMHVICQNGFEHHAAMNRSHSAAAVAEALGRYMGWDTYHHNRPADLPPIPGRF
jgi:L-fucose isomerase-like protein